MMMMMIFLRLPLGNFSGVLIWARYRKEEFVGVHIVLCGKTIEKFGPKIGKH